MRGASTRRDIWPDDDPRLLQAQYAPSAYVGLWSRVGGIKRAHLTSAPQLPQGLRTGVRKDIASYTGLHQRDIAAALERLPLRRFASEAGDELLDLPRQPLPDPDAPAAVRFLPTWDATLLVHARRAGIVREEHRPRIFSTKNPHSLPTFLVDGVVAGTWRYDKGRIELDPFEPLDRVSLKGARGRD